MNYRDMTKAKDTTNRVNRGGNYNNANAVSNRNNNNTTNNKSNIGFRTAL